ncbi:acyl-CoA synthetase [Streptomyces sp. NPDC001914]|uniref:acyl-CoA synthetase n=1 Tax=Streptomyces sp. NPDC001914 TaxID=3364623 RepID=UPI0036ACAB51
MTGTESRAPRQGTGDPLWPVYDRPSDLAAIESVPLEARGLPSSTYAAVVRAARLRPDGPALTVLPSAEEWPRAVTVTFAELLSQVHRFANLLRAHGVGRTTAVGLLSPNTALLPAALLAAQTAGIAAPVNPALSAEHAGRLLASSGTRVLIAAGPELDAEAWRTAREVARSLRLTALFALRPTACAGAAPELEPVDGVVVAHLDAAAAAHAPDRLVGVEPPAPGDLAACFHTGGTTGAPKLAAHTHANEIADAWMIAANRLLDEDSVLFAALPLFHVNALIVTVLGPLLRGQHVVWAGPSGYREPALYGVIWKIFEHHRVATLSAVPTVYSVLAQVPVDADLSALRFAVVGASALPPAVREAFEDHTGVELCEGYGLTEATCASARGFVGKDHRPGTVGQRLPYQRLRTVRVDADGAWHDLPPGEPGTLVIAGPTVFPGYVTGCGPDGPLLDSLGTVRDGWLDTGDLACVDPDGFVRLLGRAKDLIIRGGHNIDPAVVEDALLAHPAVTAASAVGRPDPHAGEVPVAYVTLGPDTAVPVAELLAFAAERVPERAAAPKDVVVWDGPLPVTDVGKRAKLPLRLDATRRAVVAELASCGVRLAPGERVGCELLDGRPLVRVPHLADRTLRLRVAAALDRYAFRWEFATEGRP